MSAGDDITGVGYDDGMENMYRVKKTDPDQGGGQDAFPDALDYEQEGDADEHEEQSAGKKMPDPLPRRSAQDLHDDVQLSTTAQELLLQQEAAAAAKANETGTDEADAAHDDDDTDDESGHIDVVA
jgi:hypothetical protein